MAAKISKIVKATSKGQITLPMHFRKKYKTDNYILEIEEKRILITPFYIEDAREEIIFDADRDNEGEGVPVEKMIRMLKQIKNG